MKCAMLYALHPFVPRFVVVFPLPPRCVPTYRRAYAARNHDFLYNAVLIRVVLGWPIF